MDQNLIIKMVEFDSKTDPERATDPNGSNGIIWEFFNPINIEKLNADLCYHTPVKISIPFKSAFRIKTNLITKFASVNSVMDLYNIKTPSYYSRCYKIIDYDSQADISINYRRMNIFQNTSIECSANCTYNGIDVNKYVKCDCISSGHKEVSNTAEDIYFIKLPSMNYEIVFCYRLAYEDPMLRQNKGFLILGGFIILNILSFCFFRKMGVQLIKSKLKDIQNNDCLPFAAEKYSKKKYFLRGYFIKNSREFNLNYVSDCLNNEKMTYFFTKFDNENINLKIDEKYKNPKENLTMNQKKKKNLFEKKTRNINSYNASLKTNNYFVGQSINVFNYPNLNISHLNYLNLEMIRIGIIFKGCAQRLLLNNKYR